MKTYIPNNINFRIVSSNSIAKFKQDQSYDFYEIVKLGNTFSSAAKEVILLEYDHWFKWILKLEKIFLLITEEDSNSSIIHQIKLLLNSEMDDIHEIMSIHTDFFRPEFTKFIHFIHKYSIQTLEKAIEEAIEGNNDKCNLGTAFTKIVFFISIYLQQILLAVQEMEMILTKEEDTPKTLFYSGWCKEVCTLHGNQCLGICPIAERAKYYSKSGSNNQFILRNMTKENLKTECIQKINNLDVKIIKIENDHVPIA